MVIKKIILEVAISIILFILLSFLTHQLLVAAKKPQVRAAEDQTILLTKNLLNLPIVEKRLLPGDFTYTNPEEDELLISLDEFAYENQLKNWRFIYLKWLDNDEVVTTTISRYASRVGDPNYYLNIHVTLPSKKKIPISVIKDDRARLLYQAGVERKNFSDQPDALSAIYFSTNFNPKFTTVGWDFEKDKLPNEFSLGKTEPKYFLWFLTSEQTFTSQLNIVLFIAITYCLFVGLTSYFISRFLFKPPTLRKFNYVYLPLLFLFSPAILILIQIYGIIIVSLYVILSRV